MVGRVYVYQGNRRSFISILCTRQYCATRFRTVAKFCLLTALGHRRLRHTDTLVVRLHYLPIVNLVRKKIKSYMSRHAIIVRCEQFHYVMRRNPDIAVTAGFLELFYVLSVHILNILGFLNEE
jgi:hypothetical protein